MAYALVGSAGAALQSATGGSDTPVYGQSPTAGNLLILWAAVDQTATLPAAISGWSIAVQKAGTSCSASIFYKIAAGSDAQPTVAGITSGVIWARLAEYSGNAASSPLDQIGSAAGTTSPQTATLAAADAATGELLIACGAVDLSGSFTNTSSLTSNNATFTAINNDGTGGPNHYAMGYGVTTAHAAADTAALGFTTAHITGAAIAAASFKLLGTPLLADQVLGRRRVFRGRPPIRGRF